MSSFQAKLKISFAGFGDNDTDPCNAKVSKIDLPVLGNRDNDADPRNAKVSKIELPVLGSDNDADPAMPKFSR